MRALVFLFALLAWMQPVAAEDGRALVVAGRVMLERSAPGAFSIAPVSAGTEVRRGDLIRTGNDGRVQIRFSDGSIVSLQPGTAFRIDEYRFAENEQRAFFFLLRGALRTVTGAIGKIRHDDYRMKTPTATVGVRGTEYVAEQTVCDPICAPGARAGLRVAVTQGRIVLLTDAGEIEVDTGQAAAAESADTPPRHTESGPVLPPISLGTPRERSTGGTATASSSGPASATSADGQTTGSAGSAGSADGSGSADASGTSGSRFAQGTGRSAAAADAGRALPSASPSTSSTNGAAAPASGTIATQAPATKDGPAQTPATAGNSAADPGADALVDVWPRFVATEAGPPAAAVSPNERRGPEGILLPVLEQLLGPGGRPGSPDGSGGTPGSGPPAGPGAGDPGTGDPVAEGPGEPGTGPGSGDPGPGTPPPLGSGTHPVDSQAAPGSSATLRVLAPPWWLAVDRNVNSGSLELDDAMRLSAFEWCRFQILCRIGKGNTTIVEAGHDAWTSWGRWTGGRATVTVADLPLLQIAGNQGLHYLVGIPSATIPTSGVFGYELVGATRPTLSTGGPTGTFDGRAAVAFSPSGAKVGVDASIAFPDSSYRFATPGGADNPALSTIATGAGHAFQGQVAATGTQAAPVDCTAGCSAQLDGGLFGPDAARLGITYRITGSGSSPTISGVGVFGKKNPQE